MGVNGVFDGMKRFFVVGEMTTLFFMFKTVCDTVIVLSFSFMSSLSAEPSEALIGAGLCTTQPSTDYNVFLRIAIRRGTILGALTLYLDFINLFLFLLRFFGSSRD